MRRRDVLAAGGLSLSLPLSAGCLETLGREDAWRELVADPPTGTYVPSKVDAMATYGTETVDGRTVSLGASRPHSFWTIAGDERARADVRTHHALHLMVAVHDAETGVVVPTTVSTSIRRGDAPVDERTLWPMLSQRMGVHYGDNVPVDGDGRYVATIRIGPTDAVVDDSLDDRLGRATTAEIEFEYAAAEIEALDRRLIDEDDGRGEAGAVEPMTHDRHGGADGHDGHGDPLDQSEGLQLGTAAGGDLEFSVSVLDDAGSDGSTLAVVPRTRYNRYPVPFASLSVAVRRDGTRVGGGALRARLDADRGHHYATTVGRDRLAAADELVIALETPPQLSRHEGYETAFLDPDPVTIDVDP